MKIYLIRHTSVEVPPGTCYGQTDVSLKSSFEEEAAATLKKLAGISFDKAYSSPLGRCTRLATYCGYPDAEKDHRIQEINFGEWEMQNFDKIKDPKLQQWYIDYLNVSPTGGESFRMQLQRVSEFLIELKRKPYERVAIFTHAGVILCAQIFTGILPIEKAFDAITPYGNIQILTL